MTPLSLISLEHYFYAQRALLMNTPLSKHSTYSKHTHYTVFFYKKPVYIEKPVLNFISELRNRVLMFQVHKTLASRFSKKRRIFVKKWRKSLSDKKPWRNWVLPLRGLLKIPPPPFVTHWKILAPAPQPRNNEASIKNYYRNKIWNSYRWWPVYKGVPGLSLFIGMEGYNSTRGVIIFSIPIKGGHFFSNW